MPGRNGMGPEGLGPKTGRGLGPCKSDNVGQVERAGDSPVNMFGRGMGAQYRGRGRGAYLAGSGNGYGRRALKGLGCYSGGRWGQYPGVFDSGDQEASQRDLKQLLEQQNEMLQLMKEIIHRAD